MPGSLMTAMLNLVYPRGAWHVMLSACDAVDALSVDRAWPGWIISFLPLPPPPPPLSPLDHKLQLQLSYLLF